MNWQQNTTTALWISAFFIFIGFQIFVALMVIDTGHLRLRLRSGAHFHPPLPQCIRPSSPEPDSPR